MKLSEEIRQIDKATAREPIYSSVDAEFAVRAGSWAARAELLEKENEELKCKLDEYIEQERARMEQPQSRNLVPKGMVLLPEGEFKRLKALDRR